MRVIHQAEAVAWLKARGPLAGASVVTSLPDVSELPSLGFEGWCRWFEEAAAVVMDSVPPEGVAIFFQSDIRQYAATDGDAEAKDHQQNKTIG